MKENQTVRFLRMGEACIVVEFGTTIDPEVNERVHRLARRLKEACSHSRVPPLSPTGDSFLHPETTTHGDVNLQGIRELVPTYRSLAVYFDPLVVTRTLLEERIAAFVQEMESPEPSEVLAEDRKLGQQGKTVVVPVCYGGEYGPDLEFVARHTGLSEAEVVRIHTSRTYRVYMLGFLPGFPYLGGMDERIATPRLETPRTRIPAGSVGIAGSQTGFYPLESPGGWRIIGRTPIKAFDPFSDTPFLLSPGDFVQFTYIPEGEYRKLSESGGRP
ncbi:MAG: 5-oxoprolinase subunit PxpB [Spirochaetes bacterium]|nr:5-oxoprolinase subunit PxpB [Spirochaetota bacterium]